jgi:predicted lipoprotein with Yx(FWY)xxD motif
VRKCLRQRVLLVIVASIVTVGAAAAASSAASIVTIDVSSALGSKILVTSNGLTLYHDMGETHGAIKCVGACAKVWLPILASVSAKPQAGPGLSAAKLGTVKRPDGKLQVTYNGLALYHYAPDKAGGQTKGQGLNGQWFAVTSAGAVTRTTRAGSTPTSSTSTGGTSSGGGTSGPLPTVACNPAVVVTDPNDPCYNTAH